MFVDTNTQLNYLSNIKYKLDWGESDSVDCIYKISVGSADYAPDKVTDDFGARKIS